MKEATFQIILIDKTNKPDGTGVLILGKTARQEHTRSNSFPSAGCGPEFFTSFSTSFQISAILRAFF